jgi:hypothetical protein
VWGDEVSDADFVPFFLCLYFNLLFSVINMVGVNKILKQLAELVTKLQVEANEQARLRGQPRP